MRLLTLGVLILSPSSPKQFSLIEDSKIATSNSGFLLFLLFRCNTPDTPSSAVLMAHPTLTTVNLIK
jgi:hypothetical protein